MDTVEFYKKELDEFVANGGDVNSLTKKDRVYQHISVAKIFRQDGKKCTLEEKFAILGHPRKQKRTHNIEESIKKKIAEYKASGRKIEDLKTSDPLYKYIKNSHFKGKDGKTKTIKEVLAYFGEYREERKDIEPLLIESIEKFIADGGDLNSKRDDLPFNRRLNHYASKNGMSPEQAMHKLGYREYSDIYYRLRGLEKIASFRDEEGYVDGYRQDEIFRNYVGGVSRFLNIPVALVVMLVCDEKLKNFYFPTEYLEFVSKKLQTYIDENGNLDSLSTKDKKLYDQLWRIRKGIFADLKEEVTNEEILYMLGIEDVKNNLQKRGIQLPSFNALMDEAYEVVKEKGGKLTRNDLPAKTYRSLLVYSSRMAVPLEELFRVNGIEYVGGKNAERFSRVFLEEYPYLEEMKKRRDELIAISGVSEENGNCKEEIFEKKIEASVEAYLEYARMLDENFNMDLDYKSKKKQVKNIEKN